MFLDKEEIRIAEECIVLDHRWCETNIDVKRAEEDFLFCEVRDKEAMMRGPREGRTTWHEFVRALSGEAEAASVRSVFAQTQIEEMLRRNKERESRRKEEASEEESRQTWNMML